MPESPGSVLRDMLAKGDITEAVFNKVVRGNAERILGV